MGTHTRKLSRAAETDKKGNVLKGNQHFLYTTLDFTDLYLAARVLSANKIRNVGNHHWETLPPDQ